MRTFPDFPKQVGTGVAVWIIPLVVSFFFVDQMGNFRINMIFFKSIMVVVGMATATPIALWYFKSLSTDYLKKGIEVGLVWLIINWSLDLLLVKIGFFQMTTVTYFTEIGLRYLSMPILTIGLGWLAEYMAGPQLKAE